MVESKVTASAIPGRAQGILLKLLENAYGSRDMLQVSGLKAG